MAGKVGVSSSTVANRINDLEKRGVILSNHPIINYSETGLGHHLLVTATVPRDREKMMDGIMEVSGIVSIRELLTNKENLSLEVVGTSEDIEETLESLDSLGVDIERMRMMKQERTNPYNHFGKSLRTRRTLDNFQSLLTPSGNYQYADDSMKGELL